MVLEQRESTRSLVIRALLVGIALFVGLTLTMPHRSLARRTTTTVLTIGALLGVVLYRRREKTVE